MGDADRSEAAGWERSGFSPEEGKGSFEAWEMQIGRKPRDKKGRARRNKGRAFSGHGRCGSAGSAAGWERVGLPESKEGPGKELLFFRRADRCLGIIASGGE